MSNKFKKDIKGTLRCDYLFYEGYRTCLLDVMNKVMKIDKKSKKKKSNKSGK